MKEREYAVVSNRAAIGLALSALREVTTGKDYGVPERQFRRITKKLAKLQQELFAELHEMGIEED